MAGSPGGSRGLHPEVWLSRGQPEAQSRRPRGLVPVALVHVVHPLSVRSPTVSPKVSVVHVKLRTSASPASEMAVSPAQASLDACVVAASSTASKEAKVLPLAQPVKASEGPTAPTSNTASIWSHRSAKMGVRGEWRMSTSQRSTIDRHVASPQMRAMGPKLSSVATSPQKTVMTGMMRLTSRRRERTSFASEMSECTLVRPRARRSTFPKSRSSSTSRAKSAGESLACARTAAAESSTMSAACAVIAVAERSISSLSVTRPWSMSERPVQPEMEKRSTSTRPARRETRAVFTWDWR
mmetsp:Transcript_4055/g.11520  ORF Transcript_4055/g.11520 Transcript_4055/m.11520 type:complete len:297 (+) Transcript_4055:739-1629(+)